jgi:hypothetical protein
MAGTGYINGAFETTVGSESNSSPTLSSKVIYIPAQSAALNLNPSPLERDDELRGVDEPIAVLEDSHAPSWSLATRAYPDVLGFLLKSQLGAPTSTTGNGVITDANGVVVPTGAYRHTWTAPFGPSGSSPQTTQWRASYADQSVYYKAQGCATESLEFSVPETGGVGVSASGPATYLTRISDPSLTASYETLTIPPFLSANLSIGTDLSGAQGAEGEFSFAINNPVEAVRDHSSASRFPNQMYKADGSIGLSGSVRRALLDADEWDALKANTGFALKFTFTSSAAIASSYPYKMIVSVGNVQYVGGGPEELASRRRIGASFNWRAGYSGSAGNIAVQVVNATSSYA